MFTIVLSPHVMVTLCRLYGRDFKSVIYEYTTVTMDGLLLFFFSVVTTTTTIKACAPPLPEEEPCHADQEEAVA